MDVIDEQNGGSGENVSRRGLYRLFGMVGHRFLLIPDDF
jgi:hypothetical protein